MVKALDKAIRMCDAGPNMRYEVIVDGKSVGTVQIFNQALNAAQGYAKKIGKAVKIRELPTGKLWSVNPDGSTKW